MVSRFRPAKRRASASGLARSLVAHFLWIPGTVAARLEGHACGKFRIASTCRPTIRSLGFHPASGGVFDALHEHIHVTEGRAWTRLVGTCPRTLAVCALQVRRIALVNAVGGTTSAVPFARPDVALLSARHRAYRAVGCIRTRVRNTKTFHAHLFVAFDGDEIATSIRLLDAACRNVALAAPGSGAFVFARRGFAIGGELGFRLAAVDTLRPLKRQTPILASLALKEHIVTLAVAGTRDAGILARPGHATELWMAHRVCRCAVRLRTTRAPSGVEHTIDKYAVIADAHPERTRRFRWAGASLGHARSHLARFRGCA